MWNTNDSKKKLLLFSSLLHVRSYWNIDYVDGSYDGWEKERAKMRVFLFILSETECKQKIKWKTTSKFSIKN